MVRKLLAKDRGDFLSLLKENFGRLDESEFDKVIQDPNYICFVYEEEGKVIAYLRSFWKENDVIQMGRVLTVEHGKGLGGKLLKAGIEEIKAKQNPKKIFIEAQCYATGYYAREGFEICSEEFLEDGIPHVEMELVL